ncbi:hypothetical protein [Minwuia sp.]|uniref:hypothetical protein n=1 Tax=Minwuia sp. TaxID=2493630 RepID=UPI003A93A7BE
MEPHVRQSGYAIAAISIMGLAAMTSAAILVQESGVTEADAVEENLVRVRANWAAQGHLNYILSRLREDGSCNNDCKSSDNTRVSRTDGFGNELTNANQNGPSANGNRRRWQYAEIDENYAIDVALEAFDAGGTSDGKIQVDTVFLGSSVRLQNVDQVLTRMTGLTATICTALTSSGDTCPVAVADTDVGGIARIEDFRVLR